MLTDSTKQQQLQFSAPDFSLRLVLCEALGVRLCRQRRPGFSVLERQNDELEVARVCVIGNIQSIYTSSHFSLIIRVDGGLEPIPVGSEATGGVRLITGLSSR